jgi:hypothetical protein
MAYAYDRSAEPSYFEDTNPSLRRDESASTENRVSPSKTDRMTTSSAASDGVSPQLISEITERVKKERK